MKVINHFKGVTDDEKLALYYHIVKALTKGDTEHESTICKAITGQKRQPVNRRTNRAVQNDDKANR